jgi:hypothetical protein
MNDLARLFDEGERPRAYHGYADEIAAVQRGEKAICMFSFPRSAVDDNDQHYLDVAQRTLDAGLTLTLRQDPFSAPPPHDGVYVFAHREGEAWRVSAWLATATIVSEYPPWSDGLEALQSALLGYPEEQIAQWIAYHRARQLGWVGRTVYILMTLDLRQRIVEHGSRSLPDGMPADDVLLCFVDRNRRAMRRDAAEQCGPGHALARIAIATDSYMTMFGSLLEATDAEVVSVELPASRAVSINKVFESKIEFLSPDGWS